MGINAIFNTASSSLTAQRIALDVTGENIANVNTEGYSRQRVILDTAAPTTHISGFPLGSGVNVTAVQRIYDNVLNKQINDGISVQGNSEQKLSSLKQLEPYFNELTGNALGDAMQGLTDAWQSLSLNPAGLAERQAVLGKATIMTDTFHQINNSITNVQTFADQSITSVATDITQKAKDIASLNSQITITEQASGNANELRDKRDLLIQQLSKQVGVTYAEQPNGSVTVKLPGGQDLVNGINYATVYSNQAGPPVTSNTILITATGNPPPATVPATDTNVTATIGGSGNSLGEIGGLLYTRDTAMPSYLAKLDELAYNLAQQTNAVHAAGWNLNNATGINFFSPATAIAPPAPAATFAGYSQNITVAITDTNAIAAADTNPLTGGTGNNKNALLLKGLADTPVAFAGGVQVSTASYYNALVSSVGVDVQSATNRDTQNVAFIKQLSSLRESNSGVSLDEELINLMKYQKAFQGASKVISTATEMMDTILGMIR
ncbi:MAG: flagellar hook-associated protein FlgK [Desulfuromonadales bacterium]|nr:flagellar hook-associated protein FlgK [Desulfuromonadales bacterium]